MPQRRNALHRGAESASIRGPAQSANHRIMVLATGGTVKREQRAFGSIIRFFVQCFELDPLGFDRVELAYAAPNSLALAKVVRLGQLHALCCRRLIACAGGKERQPCVSCLAPLTRRLIE